MGKRLHVLTDINPDTKTATCQHCGVIPVVLRSATVPPRGVRGKRWTCSVVNRQRWQAVAANPAYAPARERAHERACAARKAAKLSTTTFGEGVDKFEAKPLEPTPVPPAEELEELLNSFGDSFGDLLG